MDNDLTREADLMILTMYHDYLESRKLGKSIRNSRYFDPFKLHKTGFKEYQNDDFNDLIRELDRHQYVDVMYGNNVPMRVCLSDKAIRTEENRFKNQMNQVADSIIKIKKMILPFS